MSDIKQAQALVNLRHLNSKFLANLKELTGLKKSVEDAYGNNETTIEDGKALLDQLKELTLLKQKNADSIDAFTDNYGSAAPNEVAEADKAFQNALDAYICLKKDVETLARKVQRQKTQPVPTIILDTPDNAVDRKFQEKEEVYSIGVLVEAVAKPKSEQIAKRQNATEEQSRMKMNKVVPKKTEGTPMRNRSTITNICRKVSCGILIIGTFYFGLYLIISHTHKSRLLANVKDEETLIPKNISAGNETCGANSFMIRDAVCDEVTNNAKCLFDGGDCCLEIKATHLCRDCKCQLTIDQDKLQQQFADLAVAPLKSLEVLTIEDNAIFDWTAMVETVVSGPVCAVLCLENDAPVNLWTYHSSFQVCKCGWIHSGIQCPEDLVNTTWTSSNVTADLFDAGNGTVFVQLEKTLACRCLALDFKLLGERTFLNHKEGSLQGASFVISAWHCQQKCQNDPDCRFFSWNSLPIILRASTCGAPRGENFFL